MINKKFWATVFTLTGTIIGAGILGLPYIFAQSSYLIGILWLITITTIMTFTNLVLGEMTLKTKGSHQLPGYAKKYIGKWGKIAMTTAVIFGIYAALLAYLIGEGQSFAKIISPTTPPIIFGITFWLIMTLLLQQGLKGLKKVETWGVIAIILIVLAIFIKLLPQINPQNLTTINTNNIASPIGVIMFSLLGFMAIPELKKELKNQQHLLRKAIILGSTIPAILYIIFTATFVGILGKNITEVATLSFGPIITILGIFTMFTSYFSLSFALKDSLKSDLKIKQPLTFILSCILPLALYMTTTIFKIASFSSILGIGGVISAGTTAILILIMAHKAKSSNKIKFSLPLNKTIIIILLVFFTTSIIIQLFF